MSTDEALIQNNEGYKVLDAIRNNDGDVLAEINEANALRELKTVQSNLDFWPGLSILFTIAFGPTFIALNLLIIRTQEKQMSALNATNWGVIAVFVCFFVFNWFSINMLNVAYKQKQLGSF